MTVIRQDDFIDSVADALQFISYYHPLDFVKAVNEAYEREQNPADRRSVLIHLSEEGQRTIEAMETGILHFIVELMEELGDVRVREWRGVYDKIGDIPTKRRAEAGTEPVQA